MLFPCVRGSARYTIAAASLALLASLVAGDVANAQPARTLANRQRTSSTDAASAHQATLKQYCVTCHNQRLKTAKLELDALDPTRAAADAATWEKVIRRLRLGTMPPAGLPRPDQSVADALASWLEDTIDRAARTTPNPGRSPRVHRLNRSEYANAVRDLLAVEIDVASLLPADDADQHGFDNVADVLSVSPTLLERYLTAARKISRVAVGAMPNGQASETYNVPLLRFQDDRVSEDLPFGSRGGLAVRHYFPADGDYSIKIRLLRTYVDCIKGLGAPHDLEVRIDGTRIKRFTIGGEDRGKPAPASFCGNLFGDAEWDFYIREADADLEVRMPVKAGTHLVGVAFAREVWEPEGVVQPRVPSFTFAIDEMYDGLPSVDQVTVSGPLTTVGRSETASRARIFTCHPTSGDETGQRASEDACAREILTALARRAYRRPATDKDIQTLTRFFEAGRRRGSFDTGIQAALERVLVAPDFLFRFEARPPRVAAGALYPISDVELASQLSFFLWSSIPDDELLDLAAQGRLRNPATLDQQVRRMLADPRATALVDNFVGQWLELRNIRGAAPDPELFRDFDENLRDAFLQETELFFASQLREDRSVLESLKANYTFVNERLARHYGIPQVYGSRFRRVTLDSSDRFAGFLSHGSLLTVTSYPNRTSPVLRGKWVLNNLLGSPVPPPPPDVPSLPEQGEGGKPASVRERLERHRRNPVCASCHSQMDPLGFALENFDPIGRWRTTDAGGAIDASAALAGGSPFAGPTGLRDLLLEHREQFVGTVTEKLLAYALGRGIEYNDRPTIRSIVSASAANDYRWSSIVLGIVRSTPFQMRRAETTDTLADARRAAGRAEPVERRPGIDPR